MAKISMNASKFATRSRYVACGACALCGAGEECESKKAVVDRDLSWLRAGGQPWLLEAGFPPECVCAVFYLGGSVVFAACPEYDLFCINARVANNSACVPYIDYFKAHKRPAGGEWDITFVNHFQTAEKKARGGGSKGNLLEVVREVARASWQA